MPLASRSLLSTSVEYGALSTSMLPCSAQTGVPGTQVCALWTPDVRLRRGADLAVVEGVPGLGPERWAAAACSVCGSAQGVVLRCGAGHCSLPFHTLCARNAGLYLAARGAPQFLGLSSQRGVTAPKPGTAAVEDKLQPYALGCSTRSGGGSSLPCLLTGLCNRKQARQRKEHLWYAGEVGQKTVYRAYCALHSEAQRRRDMELAAGVRAALVCLLPHMHLRLHAL